MTKKISAKDLIKESSRRMQELYEYSFYSHGTYEDGEQNAQDPMAGGTAPAGGATPDPNAAAMGDPMAGGAAPAGGTDPNAMGGDPNAMAGGAAPDPNAAAMGDPMAGGAAPAGGTDPNAMGGGMNLAPNAGENGGADPSGMGGDPMGGGMPGQDDNVIEITQLTDTQSQMQQAQDEQNEKLDGVDKKLTTLMSVVDKFTQALDANDAKLNDLKDELRKRTPTEEETMNVRLDAGGNPFRQKPEEYWENFKDINNHYNITANNDAPQYQIRKRDIENVNDKLIDDEFDKIPSTLREYFIIRERENPLFQ